MIKELHVFKTAARALGQSLAVVWIVLIFAAPGWTGTVSNYHARIEAALKNVTKLRMQQKELSDGDRSPKESIAKILGLIPRRETIDLSGAAIETDNGWLHDGLTSILAADPAEGAAILLAVEERLTAVNEQLQSLDEITTAANSKDENKQKIAEILRRAEYQPPQEKGESLIQKWIREFTEWLASVFPRAPVLPDTASGEGTLKSALQVLVFVIVIGLIGFLVYKFAPMISYRLTGRRQKKRDDRVILGERISGEVSAVDLFSEAELLAAQGNLRGAIRKGYVSLLCDLSDRKLLRLARHKTNKDYLRDIRKDHTIFDNMLGLTGAFERNWYGLRTVEPADWEEFRLRYHETVKNAGGQK